MKAEERREFPRLNILTDVIYTKLAVQDKEKLSLTKNISQSGICIISYEELKESDILGLRIYLPDDKTPIDAVGRVVWIKGFIIGDISKGKRYDAGVEFIKISAKDKEKINKYVFTHK